jgi:hypothetical protein
MHAYQIRQNDQIQKVYLGHNDDRIQNEFQDDDQIKKMTWVEKMACAKRSTRSESLIGQKRSP